MSAPLPTAKPVGASVKPVNPPTTTRSDASSVMVSGIPMLVSMPSSSGKYESLCSQAPPGRTLH